MNIVEKLVRGRQAGASTEAHRCGNGSPQPRASAWCVFALLLLLPGSFVVLPLLWLVKRWAARQRPQAMIP